MGQGYTFFWKGQPPREPGHHGKGLAIWSNIARTLKEQTKGHSTRLISVWIPLERSNYITIICAYTRTLVADEGANEHFYCSLIQLIQNVNRKVKLWVLGDFKVRVAADATVLPGVKGRHDRGSMNRNCLRLLTLSPQFYLTLTNTRFQLINVLRNTCKHPGSGHSHMLTRRKHMPEWLIVLASRERWSNRKNCLEK